MPPPPGSPQQSRGGRARDGSPPTQTQRPHPRTGPAAAENSGAGPSDSEPGRSETGDDLDTFTTADGTKASRERLPVLRNLHRLAWRTVVKAFDDSIVGWSAQAAFWQALSLPPLLLGLLSSVGYVAGWFGTNTVGVIEDRIISFANRTFDESVVNDLIAPTVDNVLNRGPVGLVSTAFLMSLWAGSAAVSCFVGSIVNAHGQDGIRNPVWERIFGLLLYVVFLAAAVPILPLVALGPNILRDIVPAEWGTATSRLIEYGYFPFVALLLLGALTTLYHLALPHPLPWHRLIAGAILAGLAFWVASYLLRLYLSTIARANFTYGALATPIAFLLFAFFLGFAIVIGAEFNAAIQEMWPAEPPATAKARDWVQNQASDITDSLKTLPDRFASGPIRRTTPLPRGPASSSTQPPGDS